MKLIEANHETASLQLSWQEIKALHRALTKVHLSYSLTDDLGLINGLVAECYDREPEEVLKLLQGADRPEGTVEELQESIQWAEELFSRSSALSRRLGWLTERMRDEVKKASPPAAELRPARSLDRLRVAMASREALFACALANTPACVRLIRIREDLTGCAYPKPKSSKYGLLEAPRPVSGCALQVYLHECGHYALDHQSNRPRYLEEYETEVWSFARMREAGIPVPRQALKEAQHAVAGAIQTALARGIKRIDPKAARFAGFKRTPATRPFQFIRIGINTFIWSQKAQAARV